MFGYWLLFGVFAVGALTEHPYDHWQTPRLDVLFALAMLVLMLMVGLRYEVGGDWGSYMRLFNFFEYGTFSQIFSWGDPAYQALGWLAHQFGAGIWFVNLVCAALFSWGLYRFALTQPSPWLTIVVAIPYLVIVVAMGYTRQAVAIGIIMAGLARFQFHSSVLRFAPYVLVAALFHRTAVIALPLVAIGGRRNKLVNLMIVICATAALYDALVAQEIDRLVRNYVKTELNSTGAAIRVSMSVIPAAIFLIGRDKLGFKLHESSIWRNFAFASIAALIALPLATSTVVDRLSLYLLPLQLAVTPRLSGVSGSNAVGKLMVLSYALTIQFTWLNFGTNSFYWLPYKLTLFASP